MANLDVGSRVRGSYMHAPFTGTIRNHRAHTINHRVFLTTVDLDAPVEIKLIGRTEEKSLLVTTAWDGAPVPADAGSWGDTGDYLEVIS